jgi:hypothetical protein
MKMPPEDRIKFVIKRNNLKAFATYQWDGKQHVISLSPIAISHLDTMIEKVAHEMIHMYLEENGLESRSLDSDAHNKHFRKYAARVCKHHGWDPKAFF